MQSSVPHNGKLTETTQMPTQAMFLFAPRVHREPLFLPILALSARPGVKYTFGWLQAATRAILNCNKHGRSGRPCSTGA
jgi:hypothetical protein